MGKTKTELFSKHHNDLAAMAKAIAHPARIAILEYLLKKGSCVCRDIVDELPCLGLCRWEYWCLWRLLPVFRWLATSSGLQHTLN